ncbi:hypothetical protein MJA45_21840 [Paenibacillus aurantius]|uniref:Uncharacterized protein n=1 Tax=Paenibacillus aurantius TaxID=2918900 RepID=A0AA96RC79_9BACL|nr:hypothetical protein [Paenibacillus aurantius]WNQ10240.1 hypothetical protein MJA45_21840 [Paenibacillus aurantius]
MKVAFQLGMPEAHMLEGFWKTAGLSGETAVPIREGAGRVGLLDQVVGVYDRDRLVGLGSRVGLEAENPSAYAILLDPGYESKEIRENICKLLKPSARASDISRIYTRQPSV